MSRRGSLCVRTRRLTNHNKCAENPVRDSKEDITKLLLKVFYGREHFEYKDILN